MERTVDQPFTKEEERRLFKRFIRIDQNKNGELDVSEVMKLEKVHDNPITQRLLDLFDTNRNGSIDFDEFLNGLSIFVRSSDTEARLKFLFRMYDMNNDGYISNGDLFATLKMMIGDNLGDVQLQQIVDKTIRDADTNKDGKLSFDEFKAYAAAKNLDPREKLTLGTV